MNGDPEVLNILSEHDDLEVPECFKKHCFGSAFVLQPLTRSRKYKKIVEVITKNSRFGWRTLPLHPHQTLSKSDTNGYISGFL